MKHIPILFSTMMVQALLEGRKTMTRRVIKPQPDDDGLWNDTSFPRSLQSSLTGWNGTVDATGESKEFKCPYGQRGGVLYVREKHYRYGHWLKDGISKTGKQKWKFVPDKQFLEVRYFDNPPAVIQKNTDRVTGWYKRNSLFMPKSATRIFLQNKGVKVERLKNISDVDAKAEGVLRADLFMELWQSINGKESLDANPWLWAITFKRIDKPANFLTTTK